LKKDCIDFGFSSGVVHHTPDTYRAFKNIAELVKKKGKMYIWVYPKGNVFWEATNNFARFFTTKMPPKILYYMSYLLIPVLFIFPAYADNKPGKNTPKELVQSIYDWLSPVNQTHHTNKEMRSWYLKNSFEDIEMMSLKTGAVGTKKNE